MDRLRELLKGYNWLKPDNQEKRFLVVEYYCDFEGHGRTSETWEEHWAIKLPTVPGFWWSTTGWREAKSTGMRFHGKSYGQVYRDATKFLEWLQSQKKEK